LDVEVGGGGYVSLHIYTCSCLTEVATFGETYFSRLLGSIFQSSSEILHMKLHPSISSRHRFLCFIHPWFRFVTLAYGALVDSVVLNLLDFISN